MNPSRAVRSLLTALFNEMSLHFSNWLPYCRATNCFGQATNVFVVENFIDKANIRCPPSSSPHCSSEHHRHRLEIPPSSRMFQEDNARANTTEKAGSGPVNAKCELTPAAAITAAAAARPKPDFLRIFEEEKNSATSQEIYVCAVCEEPARGFHFGAFTCEGCKSFFGRTCLRKNHERFECKNAGRCDVVGSNRTSCKACRYKRCVSVGMSPLNSRFGRRSKYFKVSMSVSQKPVCPVLPILPPSSLSFNFPPPIIYPLFLSNLLHFYAIYRHDNPSNIP